MSAATPTTELKIGVNKSTRRQFSRFSKKDGDSASKQGYLLLFQKLMKSGSGVEASP